MTPSTCTLLADYNRWMNTRLYDAAAKLPEADLFADRGAFFGSLFNTLNHLAVADTIWLRRFASHPELGWMQEGLQPLAQPTSLTQRVADALPQLRAYREQADGVIAAMASRVTAAQLASTLHYQNTGGSRRPGTSVRWCSTFSTTRRTTADRPRRCFSRRGWMSG